MCGCGDRRLSAWISRRLVTWGVSGGPAYSNESKWFFMHLMATNLPVLMDWAFSTSEKVPSPFLEISLYSALSPAAHSACSLASKEMLLFNFNSNSHLTHFTHLNTSLASLRTPPTFRCWQNATNRLRTCLHGSDSLWSSPL